MSAPSYIRRYIENLVGDKPFSIRDFLRYGPRNTIDQVFLRLVKSGRIIRVARGVYIKSSSPQPSIIEVVQVKAAAFGRTIVVHGLQAGRSLSNKSPAQEKLVFASSGATSSFRIGSKVILLIRVSARKMQLGDSKVGLAIRALWHLGKRSCDVEMAALLVASFQQSDRKRLRLSAAFMPAWMRNCFARFSRMDCRRWDLELPNTTDRN